MQDMTRSWRSASKAYSTDLVTRVLLGDRSLFALRFWHVIAATRTNFQTALFPFQVERFHPHVKFVHSAVIFFFFGPCAK